MQYVCHDRRSELHDSSWPDHNLKALFCSVPSRLPHQMGNLGQSSSLHAAKYDIPYAAEDMLLTSYQAVQYSRVYNGIDLHTRTGMEKMAR